MQHFTRDMAGIAKHWRAQLDKRPPSRKHTTAYSSIVYAMRPRHLEYLLNVSRLVARNPNIAVPFGTAPNEAFHKELISFFRCIYTPGRDLLRGLAKVVTSVKLVAGLVKNFQFTKAQSQRLLPREYCDALEAQPLEFRPLLNVAPISTKGVDVCALDRRAKGVMRRHGVNKKPASRRV